MDTIEHEINESESIDLLGIEKVNQFPFTRIKQIMKFNQEIKNLSHETLMLITKATVYSKLNSFKNITISL